MTWKAKLKLAYPDPNDYSAFMVRERVGGGERESNHVVVFDVAIPIVRLCDTMCIQTTNRPSSRSRKSDQVDGDID